MNFIFCQLKNLKKHEFHFLQTQKTSKNNTTAGAEDQSGKKAAPKRGAASSRTRPAVLGTHHVFTPMTVFHGTSRSIAETILAQSPSEFLSAMRPSRGDAIDPLLIKMVKSQKNSKKR